MNDNDTVIDWHASPIENVFTKLNTSEKGLNSKSVRIRKKTYGLNKLKQEKGSTLLRRFLEQFNNVLIYILLISGVISITLGHIVDASVIFGVVILNAIVGCIQEGKAEKALDAIREMLSLNASVIRKGIRHTVPAEALVPGDIVMLQAGDKVPADLRIFESKSLQIQESVLTGESMPVDKAQDAVAANTSLADRTSVAYSGTLVTYGIGKGIVVATGQNTEIGKVSSMLAEVTRITTPLLRQMNIFGRWLTLAIVIASLASFLVGHLYWGDPFKEMFMAAVGIAVAAIPEGLPAIITITLAIGVTKMAKLSAIIRRLPAVETMGAVSVICTDKTGTLTKNELTVKNIVTADNSYQVTGSGYNPKGEIQLNKKPFDLEKDTNLLNLIRASVLCNHAELTNINNNWQLQGNPTDGSLLALGLKANFDIDLEKENYPRIDLIPFESEHKFMATLHHDHQGNGYIFVKGAPEKILKMCSDADNDYWQKKINELAYQGMRVVAIASKPASIKKSDLTFEDVENGLTMQAIFGIIDPPREEVIAAIADCQHAGIRVKMITGDHAITARTIADQVGIHDGHGVLIGLDLDNLSDEELIKTVNNVDIYARTSPEHKLRLVKALQENHQIVAMTGDGVNDAPALKRADIGVAMGKKGTEATKEAADMVLADDNFNSIRHAIKEGRTVYDNIKKSILFILPTNGGEGLTVMLAILFGFMLPITAVQILWVNMISAVTLGLSLGFEPPEMNVMHRQPRKPKEPILSVFLIWRIIFVSLLLTASVFGLFIFERHFGADLKVARTIVINMLVAGEIVYLINCRKIYDPCWSMKTIFGSKPILIAIFLVLFFQILFTYLPIMQHFFGTESINLFEWMRIIICSIVIFFLIEIEKIIFRRFNHSYTH